MDKKIYKNTCNIIKKKKKSYLNYHSRYPLPPAVRYYAIIFFGLWDCDTANALIKQQSFHLTL